MIMSDFLNEFFKNYAVIFEDLSRLDTRESFESINRIHRIGGFTFQ